MLRQTSRLIRVGAATLQAKGHHHHPVASLSSRASSSSSSWVSSSSPCEEFNSSISPPKILSPAATASRLLLSTRHDSPTATPMSPPPPPPLDILSLSLYMKAGIGIPGILDPINHHRVPLGSPSTNKEYIIPGVANNNSGVLEDPVPSFRIPSPIQDAPSGSGGVANIEKQAARLIVIRRIKMNKHKLRKLRKKMHYKWTKVKERRYIRKEKAYLDEQLGKIQAAMKFDAKEFVAQVIRKAKEEPLPRKWTDPLMPDWFREQEMAKEARLKRYQKVVNMYLNKRIKIKMEDR